MMKDLTHYFTSPKKETKAKKSSSTPLNNESSNNESPVTNKRKLNLSKSKSKHNTDKISVTKTAIENSDTGNEKEILEVNKKRKATEGVQGTETIANSKKIKLSKTKSKLIKSKSLCEINDDSSEKNVEESDKPSTKKVIDSDSNCEEPLVKTGKKKFNRISDSDDEITTCDIVVVPELSKSCTEKSAVIMKNTNSTRNSLLGYFNKVTKETALDKRKPEIIEVETQILPSAEGDKPPSSSLAHVSKKLKKSKKKQGNNYNYIESISSQSGTKDNSKISAELPQNHCKEENFKDAKEVVSNVKPTNIASIFITKKADKKDTSIAENSTQNNELLSAKKNENVNEEKIEPNKKEKQKKSLKVQKLTKKKSDSIEINEHKINICKETSPNTLSEEPDVKKIKRIQKKKPEASKNQNKSKTVTPMKNMNGFEKFVGMNGLEKLSQSSEDGEDSLKSSQEFSGNSKEVKIKTTNKSLENNTPLKPKLQEENIFYSKNMRTPKQKSLIKDGYITTAIGYGSSEKKESPGTKQKKSPSAWIMKVRLSASKSLPGTGSSDDESEDRVQEEVQEVEPDVNTKENEIPGSKEEEKNDIVVIIDEEGSKSGLELSDSTRPTRLSRSSRRLNYVQEQKSEPSNVPVKMWPFFQKGGARQAKDPPVDPEKLKAKMMFLESGVPEVLKRKVESEKSETQLGVPAPFPTVSHVTQNGDKAVRLEETSLASFLPCVQRQPSPPPVPAWSPLLVTGDSEEAEIPVFERLSNVKAQLEKMKEEDPKTELKALYKRLKGFKKKSEPDIWTEVYKPTKSEDIVGNSENIKKLKTWLETFKNHRRDSSLSSGDEFINDDSDGESGSVNNLAVISGPYGCGKTCAVYAIAAELDCKVLEINASCNRSGKRILAEFSESTQSHQVERSQVKNGIFNNNQSSGKPKKKKKFKKSREAKSEKTSLILVEDADLLFTDADEGFMQALSSLAATAKRPLILVTNQIKNPHLDRFQSNRPLQLTFSRPKASKLELWLRMVGLVEGVKVEADQANRLVAWSGCDVRRALLQLQLMVHSNNSELRIKPMESGLWWQWPLNRRLHYELPTLLEAEELPPPEMMDKDQRLRELDAISRTTSRLVYLDVLSTRHAHQSQTVGEQEDPCPRSWSVRCSDSTAQTQSLLAPVQDMGTDLAEWLAETVDREGRETTTSARPGGQTAEEARWFSILRQSEEMFLGGVSSMMLSNHQAVACEYLPTLRQLGRAEQVRLANYSRRANRFFNYLQGLGVHASKSYRDFMCDAFS